MTKFHSVQNSFKSGVFAERSFGRFDDDRYKDALAKSENFLSGKSGGVIKRPGSEYVLQLSGALGGALNAGPRTPQMFEIYTPTERLTLVLDLEGGGAGTYEGAIVVGDDGTIYDVGNGFNLPDVSAYPEGYHCTQVGNTVYIVHTSGTLRPMYIDLSIEHYYTLVHGINLTTKYEDCFFKDKNVTATTMTRTTVAAVIGPPAVDEYELLTSSTDFFYAGHVGAAMLFEISGVTYAAQITEYLTTKTVKIRTLLLRNGAEALAPAAGGSGLPTDATATDNWSMEAWNGVDGYPRTVSSYQQRICFGGTKTFPDTVWFTQAGNVLFNANRIASQDDASPGTSNAGVYYGYYGSKSTDHPFFVKMSADGANDISWMDGADSLAVGTVSAEYIFSGTESEFGYDAISIRRQSSQGGAKVDGQKAGSASLFVSSDKTSIFSYFYYRDNGSYIARDVTIMNDLSEINSGTSSKFRRCVYYKGTELYCIVYEETGKVVSVNTFDFGGTLNAIAAVGNYLYIAVTREIDGSDVIYLERMGADYAYADLATGHPIYCDCATTFTSPGSATLTGLSYLEGEDVQVVADGNYKGLYTVDSGEIVLDAATYTNIVVGLPYTATLKTLPINYGGVAGPSTGTFKRVSEIVALLYRTRTLKCGSEEATLDSVKFPDSTTTELYTGEVTVLPRQSPNSRGQIYLVSDLPYPCYISSLVQKGETYD